MKKLVVSLLSLFAFIFLLPQFTYAEDSIPLYLNGKKLNPEVASRIMNDTTMVPIRIVSEELGAKVSWTQEEQKVTIQKSNSEMLLWIDKSYASIDGKGYPLEVSPVNIEGNTLVPVRFVAENLGLQVKWDNETRSVHMINEPIIEQPEESTDETDPSDPTPGPDLNQTPGPQPTPNPNTDQNGQKPSTGPTVKPTPDPSLPAIESIVMNGEQLLIQGSKEMKPSHFSLLSPSRLVIDIPNYRLGQALVPQTGVNSGTIEVADHPMVSQIRYALYSDDPYTVRIVVDLKSKASYKLLEDPTTNQITVNFQPLVYKVVIDAGHGGQDPGASSLTGRKEKEFTLSTTLKVKELLDKEPLIQPLLTRSDDTYPELDERAAFANSQESDLFISIHGNKFNPEIRGTETYYWHDRSLEFAKIMHRHILDATGFPDRKVRKNNFRVITATKMPSILLEIGYLSNVEDETLMYQEEFQYKVAEGIVAGIREYLHIE
ncbi:N-acetylmuramoyl-L-alanine amidase [Chlamydia abortus]|uniref:N-acetylmuramoyl-L-alanine amidase n=2 Tax=Paenibacillus TaxID=44249 RepID=A0ABW3D3G7_9BACL|nr:N-acetylmuramoyl-L-alanine amidase family protein [Aneurinibacillus sp. XH2]SHE10958.1 N-acetylmuramoyl-L-alanine amidase [Chlamydia abortus]